jgi:hypothetical protein
VKDTYFLHLRDEMRVGGGLANEEAQVNGGTDDSDRSRLDDLVDQFRQHGLGGAPIGPVLRLIELSPCELAS